MAEQRLDDTDVGAVLKKMRREAVAKGMQRNPLAQPRRLDRRAAGGVQDGRADRTILVAARKEETLRPREPPIGAQDAQKLRRQHHVAVL